MNLFTQKMKLLTAVVPSDRADIVVKELLKRGSMEFIHVDAISKKDVDRLQQHRSKIQPQTISETRTRIESTFKQGQYPLPVLEAKDLERDTRPDFEAIRQLLDSLSHLIQTKRDRQKQLSQKSAVIEEILSYIDRKESEYYDLRVGRIENRSVEDLEARLSAAGAYCFEIENGIVSISLRRDASRIDPVMDKFQWTECSEAELQKRALEEATSFLLEKKKGLDAEIDQVQDEIRKAVEERGEELSLYWKNLRVYELCEHVESYFSQTKNTSLFSGWVPADRKAEIENIVRSETEGKCIIEWTDDTAIDRSKVPVAVSSPKILEPFEVIVRNYATPEYGSINPTPFVAVSYMLMFMLMFADIGQGLVLLLVGLIGMNYYRKHPLSKDGLLSRYLCRLLLYLGPASMLGGLLFGSTFGYGWIPALWFNYHAVVNGHAEGLIHDVYGILGITIRFGILIIFTGLILNWINLVRKKRYLTLIFDKNGLMGGILYAVGIWACFHFVGTGYRSFPSSPLLAIGIVVPMFVIFLKGPVMAVIHAREGHREKLSQVIMDTVMDFLIDALEIFSGFLSNTLSFMRVAGLGIAHVSLMTAFEDMSSLPGNPVAKVLIMVLGNVLVIAIEGLSAGIQALRLNYYEFFNRYFTGRGIAFEPVGLKSRIRIDN